MGLELVSRGLSNRGPKGVTLGLKEAKVMKIGDTVEFTSQGFRLRGTIEKAVMHGIILDEIGTRCDIAEMLTVGVMLHRTATKKFRMPFELSVAAVRLVA